MSYCRVGGWVGGWVGGCRETDLGLMEVVLTERGMESHSL